MKNGVTFSMTEVTWTWASESQQSQIRHTWQKIYKAEELGFMIEWRNGKDFNTIFSKNLEQRRYAEGC